MKTTLPATKARQKFFQLIEAAEKPGYSCTITVGGEPKVVIMSLEDFEGWQETLEIMTNKDLMRDIRLALKEVKKGKLYTEQEVNRKLKW